jgi:hypothetical protein
MLAAVMTVMSGVSPADAHLGSPYLYICGSAGKYGCTSYEWTFNSSIFGYYYNNYHIHTCTDKGGDGIYWLQVHNVDRVHLLAPATAVDRGTDW